MPKSVFLKLPEVAQDKILHAAAITLSEKGLRAATFEDIAAKLHIEVQILHHYFEGKNDMLAAVLGRAIQLLNQCFIDVAKLEKGFWERAEFLFSYAAKYGYRYHAFLNVYLNIAASGIAELAQATFDRFEGRSSLFFQNFILSGIQEGVLRDDVDVSLMAKHFHLYSRMMMARRTHPLYRARSAAYMPEISLEAKGDEQAVQRLIRHLKSIYGVQ